MSKINPINFNNDKYLQQEQGITKEDADIEISLFGDDNIIYDTDELAISNDTDSSIEAAEPEEKTSDTEPEFNEFGQITSIKFYDEDGNYTGVDKYKYDENHNQIERISYNSSGDIIYQKNNEYYPDGTPKMESEALYRDDSSPISISRSDFYPNGNKQKSVEEKFYTDGTRKEKKEQAYRENNTKQSSVYTTYDESGNQKFSTKTTFNENEYVESEQQYNSVNILVHDCQKTYHDNNELKTETEKYYEDDGTPTESFSIEYDEAGDEVGYIQYNTDGDISYRKEIKYNDEGYPIESNIYSGSDRLIQSTVSEYDSNYNKTSSVTYNSKGDITEKSEYQYDESGNILNKTTYNGQGNIIATYDYTYDEYLNPTQENIVLYDDEENEIFNAQYEYEDVWFYDWEIEEYAATRTTQFNNDTDENIRYTFQGNIGDCWLLSGINSLSYSSSGQELIKNSIEQNPNGTYTIHFEGIDTDITITQEELEYARGEDMYSSGDDDMLILELGFEAAINMIQNGEIEVTREHERLTINDGEDSFISSLDGGFFEDVMFLLTGKDVSVVSYDNENSDNKFDEILDNFEQNPDGYALSLGFLAKDLNQQAIIEDVNGEYVYTVQRSGHAFSIKSVDGDNVTIVNPADSSKEYVVSRDMIKKYAYDIEYYEFN